MSKVFHDIEKRMIRALKENPSMLSEDLEKVTELSPDQLRRGVEWLKLKKIVKIEKPTLVSLGRNGKDALEHGLPEKRLLKLLEDGPKEINTLRQELGDVFGPAMGVVKKNGWAETDGKMVMLVSAPDVFPGEGVLNELANGSIVVNTVKDIDGLDILRSRPDYILWPKSKSSMISLELDPNREIDYDDDSIDVEAPAPTVYAARTHPLRDMIEEIREIFVTLGFTEILGDLCQSSFWNFDALFTPQDHPAREMHDTLYLEGVSAGQTATPAQVRAVASAHQKGWRYRWDSKEAQKMVLRTHTTCVTIKHLAEHKPEQARIFSLGPVFRNEKTSYKHLVEFNQIEGVVVGDNATLRDLMGIQREFYRRLGLDKIKFWPTFFPYTEPSLQTMVYNEKMGKWVELFGMGIFRPEVTRPLGIKKPVLAWGGGIERIAMLKYDIDDLRQIYSNELGFLRGWSDARS